MHNRRVKFGLKIPNRLEKMSKLQGNFFDSHYRSEFYNPTGMGVRHLLDLKSKQNCDTGGVFRQHTVFTNLSDMLLFAVKLRIKDFEQS